jgi:hypothetical protein
MGVEKIFEIKDNKGKIRELTGIARQNNLVPFLGAGFSAPACPTWGNFLDRFFQGLKGEFLLPEHEKHYERLKNSSPDNRYEAMADFLVQKSGRRKFEDEMKTQHLFEKTSPVLTNMNHFYKIEPMQ